MKTALVTGGGRGIGRAICIRLAKEGYYVIVNYVSNETSAQETLAAIKADGGDGETMRFDVSDPVAVRESISAWQSAHPEDYIEVLVNNAGIRKDNLMIWMEDADWQSVLDTNLCGFYNVTKQLLKPMILKKFGRIISVASLSGLKGLPGQVNYSAAKGGLIAATKALAQEVGRKNITVNAVAPGFIVSDMTNGLDEAALKKDIPIGRFGRPEEVAAVVSFLASREASYVTGECISINGGLYC
ncbi:MAG: 3-oxoacyl-ACP reductase FabG [Bacteroidales bacterium]|nr:3-oxoacyl-ACP reductase FabG [Bacteroidales bacterium]